MSDRPPIVVAGHICLDVIPQLGGAVPGPGALSEVGAASLSTGGAVSNVGLALRHLGRTVRLIGAVGDDGFAAIVRQRLAAVGDGLDRDLVVRSDGPTSYSVVLSPPGIDRAFMHCPGVNHLFTPGEVADDALSGAAALHFGYPPLMRSVYRDAGAGLADLFGRARGHGLITSLDLAMPDPGGEAGGVDWPAWLRRVLPGIDVFLPSLDETRAVLGLPPRPADDESDLADLAERCLSWGARCVVLKLGDRGLYLRSAAGFAPASADQPSAWSDRELLVRCLEVEVAGTTGSGDCTIAGFLDAFEAGRSPLDCLAWATAVGASSVESPDATSGVPSAASLERRLAEGWPRHRGPAPEEAGWRPHLDHAGVFRGPRDAPSAN